MPITPRAASRCVCMNRGSLPYALIAPRTGERRVFRWTGGLLGGVCDAQGRPAPSSAAPANAVNAAGTAVGLTTVLAGPDRVVGYTAVP